MRRHLRMVYALREGEEPMKKKTRAPSTEGRRREVPSARRGRYASRGIAESDAILLARVIVREWRANSLRRGTLYSDEIVALEAKIADVLLARKVGSLVLGTK
jgi:hypothetical protein